MLYVKLFVQVSALQMLSTNYLILEKRINLNMPATKSQLMVALIKGLQVTHRYHMQKILMDATQKELTHGHHVQRVQSWTPCAKG